MEKETLLELVASILEVEVGEVSLGDNLEEKEWDSLSNLAFIAEMDERFGRAVDADELAQAVTVADLLSLAGASST